MSRILFWAAVMAAWVFTPGLSGLAAQGCGAPVPLSPPWPASWESSYHVEADWGGSTYGANTYFHDNGTVLDRPFFFCEGIDFGLGEDVGADGWASPVQLGDFGWEAFWGCDLTGYPMMAMMPVLLDSLLARGYDLVLVDFAAGTADIRANAAVLRKILSLTREYQIGAEPAVVAGASMGGQIARWALRGMEDDGQWPCAAAYISLDSPHNGSNIPLGLQQLVEGISQLSGSQTGLAGALQSPAARQLLCYQLDGVPDVRTNYQSGLDSLGWPQHSYNIGIANGAHSPLPGSGFPLMDYSFSALEWGGAMSELTELFQVQIHALPGDPNHPFGSPAQPVTSYIKLPLFTDSDTPFYELTGHFDADDLASAGYLDFCPGGTRPSIAQLVGILNETLEANFPGGAIGELFNAPHIGPDDFQPLHAFIPTTSALGAGLNPGWTIPVPDTINSPFDATYIAPLNEPHSEINLGNMAFLLESLDGTRLPIDLYSVNDARNLLCPDGHPWQLRSAHCTSTGQLGLHSGLGVYTAGTSVAGGLSEEGTAQLALLPCGTGLLIEGRLDVGGGDNTLDFQLHDGSQLTAENGVLHIHSGSRLQLLAGSTLDLRNSTIEIEPGGRLQVDPGASVLVQGNVAWNILDQAQVSVNGNVVVESESTLACHLTGHASLRVDADEQGLFTLGEAAEWVVSGAGSGCSIQLASDAQLKIQGSGNARWVHVSVHLQAQAQLICHSDWQLESVQGQGAQDAGCQSYRILQTEFCDFSGLHFQHHSGLWRLETCAFTGGRINIEGGRLSWRFADLVGTPLVGEQLSLTSRFYACQFLDGPLGAHLEGSGTHYFERCSFHDLVVGLELVNGSGKISCNSFTRCDQALIARRSTLELTGDGGGWNHFDMNGTHVVLDRAPLPLLAYGYNHFGIHSLHWAEGTVEMDAVCGQSISWLIPGQSWGWPNALWQIQTGLHVLVPGCLEQTVVVAVDNEATEEHPCRELERKRWGGHDVLTGAALQISPNPASSGWIDVKLEGVTKGWLQVYGPEGASVARVPWQKGGTARIECTGWSPGLYVAVDTESGASARLVVSR